MSLHHRHLTVTPYTKTRHHNLEFFCTSQCSAANMHIIHPSNNNTFHLHISASAEARLIYPAPNHYNQPIGGTCGAQGSKYIIILHSLCICHATWGYALQHILLAALTRANLGIQIGKENIISVSTSAQAARVSNASVCCTRTTVKVLVWPKISNQTVWESLEFKNSGCPGRDICWVSGLNFLRISAIILKGQVDHILPGHLDQWG